MTPRIVAAAVALATLAAAPALAAPPAPAIEHARWKTDHAQWTKDAARAREAARKLEALAAETERMIAEHEGAIARHEAPPAPHAADPAAPDQGAAVGVTRRAAEDHGAARVSHEAQRRRHVRLMEAVKVVERLPAAK
jgi:hypothetical protein